MKDNLISIITGFHAIEEHIREAAHSAKGTVSSLCLYYTVPGPRVKKILKTAAEAGIRSEECEKSILDKKVISLPEAARDHRGLVLEIKGAANRAQNLVDFDQWITLHSEGNSSLANSDPVTVIILDSVTDPHNVGAVIRSADQFGVSLVIIPERRGVNNIANNEIIARTSAGASVWVKTAVVPNLVRTVNKLKEIGFWIYGADAGGETITRIKFAQKSAVVMGSEGIGIGRLLGKNCDTIVSIPTCGKIDSLNVSVAAGVIMYEIYRRNL